MKIRGNGMLQLEVFKNFYFRTAFSASGKFIATVVCLAIILAFAHSDSVAAVEAAAQNYFEPKEPSWKRPDFPSTIVEKGSALDTRSLFKRSPAGELGRVVINKKGYFEFERQSGKNLRFFGFNGFGHGHFSANSPLSKEQRLKLLRENAEQVAVQGYDLMRLHGVLDSVPFTLSKEDQTINSDSIDLLDYQINEFKKQGIYLLGTLTSFHLGFSDTKAAHGKRNTNKVLVLFGEPTLRGQIAKYITALLNHVNPYTQLAWKDDPVFIGFENYNEQELAVRHLFWGKRIDIAPDAIEYINKRFREYLTEKYKNIAAINERYASQYKSFNEIVLPTDKEPVGTIGGDWQEFHMTAAMECYRWYEKIMRDAGYKGWICHFNFSKSMNYSALRAMTTDAVIMNTYFNHPTDWSNKGSKVLQNSSIDSLANYWTTVAAVNSGDRPLLVGEYNHCYWNQYLYEGGLLFPAYSALQDFSALIIHVKPVIAQKGTRAPSSFSAGDIPTMRVNEFLSAMLFKRGDVKSSPHRIELDISRSFLTANVNGIKAVSGWQSSLALLAKLTVSFPEHVKSRIPLPPADIVLHAQDGASIFTADWYANVAQEASTPLQIEQTIKEMRQKGIIAASNKTDPRQRIFVSDTEEIELRANEKLLKITTAKTEAVALLANAAEERLNCLTIKSVSTQGTIAVTSVDNNEIRNSRRMVLIYNTCTATEKGKWSEDRVTLLESSPEIILQTGVFEIELRVSPNMKFRLYPLSINGIRRAALPVLHENGVLKIKVDTAALPNGVTPFFELAEDVQ